MSSVYVLVRWADRSTWRFDSVSEAAKAMPTVLADRDDVSLFKLPSVSRGMGDLIADGAWPHLEWSGNS